MGLFAHKRNKAYLERRQWTAWFAAFALIAQMLVPFGQALAFEADQGVEYQVICTANGIKQIPLEESGAPLEPGDTTSCPFCMVHGALALFTPQQTALVVMDEPAAHAAFSLPLQQVQTSIWRGSLRPSRAPPLFV